MEKNLKKWNYEYVYRVDNQTIRVLVYKNLSTKELFYRCIVSRKFTTRTEVNEGDFQKLCRDKDTGSYTLNVDGKEYFLKDMRRIYVSQF